MEGVVVMDPTQSVGTLMTDIANEDEPIMPSAAAANANGGASLAISSVGPNIKSTRRRKAGIVKSKKSREGNAAGGSGGGLNDTGSEGNLGIAKPYLQMTIHTQQDTQRKLEIQINRTAHTPDFKPGAYQAAKLSDDAAQLLADFIQRPAIRTQLQPLLGTLLLGDLPKRKRKARVETGDEGLPVEKAVKTKKSVVISEETGRRLKTRLSTQQTCVLEEKYAMKPQWKLAECAELVPELSVLGGGPELTSGQISRWFDNKRRAVKRCDERAEAGEMAEKRTWKKRKVEKRVRHSEREMLEAAYAQNCAPDIHVRTALATAINISEKQVTAWFTRRQQTGRAPYGVSPGSQAGNNSTQVRGGSGPHNGGRQGGQQQVRHGGGGQMHGVTQGRVGNQQHQQQQQQQQHMLPAHLAATSHLRGATHLLLPQAVAQGDFNPGLQPSILGGLPPPGTQPAGHMPPGGIPLVNRPPAPPGGGHSVWGW